MGKTKQGYKQIIGEIPIDMYDTIKVYNHMSARQLNVSKAIEQCLGKEVDIIRQEAVQFFAERKHGFGFVSERVYGLIVSEIESDQSPDHIFKIAVNDLYGLYRKEMKEIEWLKLVIPTKYNHNAEAKKVCFFANNVLLLVVKTIR